MSIDVTENNAGGLQIEWRDILLTLQSNDHHGLSGSIAIEGKDGKVHVLAFHGQSRKNQFPMELHEELLNEDGSPASRKK